MSDLGPRYKVEAVLGSGAFGKVYRARDTRLDRLVAVKEVPGAAGDPEVAARLRREAELATRVRHPNLVDLLDVGATPASTPFLVFELVPGQTLAERLTNRSPPPEDILTWIGELADALAALHDAGVVHRDLKPANVLIHEDGRALLADLGLARADRDATVLTRTGALLGTPLYMPPEVFASGADAGPAGDLYALGALAYRGLYGEDWRDIEDVQRLLAGAPCPPARTPTARLGRFPDHDPWLAALLEEDPTRRLGPAARVAARVRGEEPTPSSAQVPRPAPPPPRRWWLGAAAPALALAVLGGALASRSRAPSAPEPPPAPAPPEAPPDRGIDLAALGARLPDFPPAIADVRDIEDPRAQVLDAAFPLRLGRFLLGIQEYCSYGPPRGPARDWFEHVYRRIQRLLNAWNKMDAFYQSAKALGRGQLHTPDLDEVNRLRAAEEELHGRFQRYLEEAQRSGRLGRSGREDVVHTQFATHTGTPVGPALMRSLLRDLEDEADPFWRYTFLIEIENILVVRSRVGFADADVPGVVDQVMARADRTYQAGQLGPWTAELERALHFDLIRQQVVGAAGAPDPVRDRRFDEQLAALLAYFRERGRPGDARILAARIQEAVSSRQGMPLGMTLDQPRLRPLAERWIRLRELAGMSPPDLTTF